MLTALLSWKKSEPAEEKTLPANVSSVKTALGHHSPLGQTKAEKMVEEVFAASLAVGGTLSGEHGVGVMKRPYLEQALGPVSMDLHRRIKHALDPHNLLNPGKILPER